MKQAFRFELNPTKAHAPPWARYGSKLVVDKSFPSTKTCSGCGEVAQEIPLSQRTFVCGSCGLSIDRNLNAAINLESASPAGLTVTLNRPVERKPGHDGNALMKLASMPTKLAGSRNRTAKLERDLHRFRGTAR